VAFSNILIKVINFIVTVTLARLLDPEHFGLVSLGLVVVNFFEIFRDMGALMYPLTMRYGIAGTAFAALIPSTLNVFLTFREAGKIIEEDFFYIAKTFIPGIVGSLVMVIVI
jgi:O-antigen/teichoic acid export membrane protein